MTTKSIHGIKERQDIEMRAANTTYMDKWLVWRITYVKAFHLIRAA